jgi:hypothetical protein
VLSRNIFTIAISAIALALGLAGSVGAQPASFVQGPAPAPGPTGPVEESAHAMGASVGCQGSVGVDFQFGPGINP